MPSVEATATGATDEATNVERGITIATGIDSESLSTTPSPSLAPITRVLVPIQLDVLVVRAAGGQWADCTLGSVEEQPAAGAGEQTAAGAGEQTSQGASAAPPPFAELQQPRAPGAYLLWSLPSALTRVTQSPPEDSTASPAKVTAPTLPDRWLVVRMFAGASNTRTLAAWVLETDSEDPRVTPLDSWTEPGSAAGAATRVETQSPLSATPYFDAVENRLAFYDSLADTNAGAPLSGPLAYLVCGWYAAAGSDPLAADGTFQGFCGALEGLEWSLSPDDLQELTEQAQAVSNATTWLRRPSYQQRNPALSSPGGSSSSGLDWTPLTLLHGAAVGIGWPTVGIPGYPAGLLGADVGGPPSAGEVTVALGTTLADTVGCLVANENKAPNEATLVEALQLGAMAALDAPDAPAQIDALLHASGFVANAGKEKLTDTVPPGPGLQAAASPPSLFPPMTQPQAPADGVTDASTGTLLKIPAKGTLGKLPLTTPAEQAAPPQPTNVTRAGPRTFQPADPVLVLQGAGRSYKHGADTRFSSDGTLACRLASDLVLLIASHSASGQLLPADPYDMLERMLHNGSVPGECEALLRETVLLDPGAATAAAASATNIANAGGAGLATDAAALAKLAEDFTVEQTVWWALRDPRADHVKLLQRLSIDGTLPEPIAITPPAPPWQPRRVEWEVAYAPSSTGFRSWTLEEVDYAPVQTAVGPPVNLAGRCLLTSGPANTIGAAAKRAIAMIESLGSAQTATSQEPLQSAVPLKAELETTLADSLQLGELDELVVELAHADMIGGSMAGLHEQLALTSPLRAGQLGFARLRLVDAWGQFVDLLTSDATAPSSQLVLSATLAGSQAAIAELPPRFIPPAQLLLRYMRPDDSAEANTIDSPVCGYLLPDHLDGALEFFDTDGVNLGSVCRDQTAGVVWQEPPGTPTAVGTSLSANASAQPARILAYPHLAQIALSLVTAGAADAGAANAGAPSEGILLALLRLIDSTLWRVDPFGHAGDEHRSLLVGHPIVVLRGQLKLTVDLASADASGQALVAGAPVSVRLGSLSQWQDGLLGYYTDDDYSVLHAVRGVAAELARSFGPMRGFLGPASLLASVSSGWAAATGETPVEHPTIDTGGSVEIYPGQELPLTMLVMPHTLVHATSGVLPRSDVGMRREWINEALARIAPTFRFGPLVLDPTAIRIPVAHDIEGSWTWAHREDASTWKSEPVASSTQAAGLPHGRASAESGWLILAPPPPPPGASGAQSSYQVKLQGTLRERDASQYR